MHVQAREGGEHPCPRAGGARQTDTADLHEIRVIKQSRTRRKADLRAGPQRWQICWRQVGRGEHSG